jgi:polar amino acid transport system permease protein
MEGIELLWQNRHILFSGMQQTVYIAAFALMLSILGGMVVGFLRIIKNPILVTITRAYLEAFRIIPLIVWLFAAFFTLPRLMGQYVSGTTSAILVFTLWGSAEIGEMVRGALQSLPAIQRESGTALGLSSSQLFMNVLLPQALRRLMPGVINMATRLIKTTSITTLVGVIEIFARGTQIIERTQESFAIYVFIFFFFFFLCYPLTVWSRHLEKKTVLGR